MGDNDLAPIHVQVHLPERRRRYPTQGVLACCCSCCCCCLHTVGSVLGAWRAVAEPPRGTTRTSPRRRAAPDPRLASEALAQYAFFHAADLAARDGELPPAAFERVGADVRAQVQRIWEGVFPGGNAEACAWTMERLPMLAAEGAVPQAAVKTLWNELAPHSVGAPSRKSQGPLAALWHLHSLYMILDEAAEHGKLPKTALPRVRDALHKRVFATLEARAPGRDAGTSTLSAAERERVRILVESSRLEPPQKAALAKRLGFAIGTSPVGPVALSTERATCEVCGEGLAGWPTVSCAACETPHHQDCWQYNQRCAMFACGCADVLGRQGPPARPLRYRLESVPRPKKEAADNGADRLAAFEKARTEAVLIYWSLTAIFCAAFVAAKAHDFSTTWLAIAVALLLPGFQLAASVATAVVLLLLYNGGRGSSAGLHQLWEMTKYSFLGTLGGLAVMFLAYHMMRLH